MPDEIWADLNSLYVHEKKYVYLHNDNNNIKKEGKKKYDRSDTNISLVKFNNLVDHLGRSSNKNRKQMG